MSQQNPNTSVTELTEEQGQRLGDYITQMWNRWQRGETISHVVTYVDGRPAGWFPLNLPTLVAQALDGTLVLRRDVPSSSDPDFRAYIEDLIEALTDLNDMDIVSYNIDCGDEGWESVESDPLSVQEQLENDLRDLLADRTSAACAPIDSGSISVQLTVVVPCNVPPAGPLVVRGSSVYAPDYEEALVSFPDNVDVTVERQQYSPRRQAYRLDLMLLNTPGFTCACEEDDWDDLDEDEDDWA